MRDQPPTQTPSHTRARTQDSLGGNAYICILACVSGEPADMEETLLTLKYAAGARRIRGAPTLTRKVTTEKHVQQVRQRLMTLLTRSAAGVLAAAGDAPAPVGAGATAGLKLLRQLPEEAVWQLLLEMQLQLRAVGEQAALATSAAGGISAESSAAALAGGQLDWQQAVVDMVRRSRQGLVGEGSSDLGGGGGDDDEDSSGDRDNSPEVVEEEAAAEVEEGLDNILPLGGSSSPTHLEQAQRAAVGRGSVGMSLGNWLQSGGGGAAVRASRQGSGPGPLELSGPSGSSGAGSFSLPSLGGDEQVSSPQAFRRRHGEGAEGDLDGYDDDDDEEGLGPLAGGPRVRRAKDPMRCSTAALSAFQPPYSHCMSFPVEALATDDSGVAWTTPGPSPVSSPMRRSAFGEDGGTSPGAGLPRTWSELPFDERMAVLERCYGGDEAARNGGKQQQGQQQQQRAAAAAEAHAQEETLFKASKQLLMQQHHQPKQRAPSPAGHPAKQKQYAKPPQLSISRLPAMTAGAAMLSPARQAQGLLRTAATRLPRTPSSASVAGGGESSGVPSPRPSPASPLPSPKPQTPTSSSPSRLPTRPQEHAQAPPPRAPQSPLAARHASKIAAAPVPAAPTRMRATPPRGGSPLPTTPQATSRPGTPGSAAAARGGSGSLSRTSSLASSKGGAVANDASAAGAAVAAVAAGSTGGSTGGHTWTPSAWAAGSGGGSSTPPTTRIPAGVRAAQLPASPPVAGRSPQGSIASKPGAAATTPPLPPAPAAAPVRVGPSAVAEGRETPKSEPSPASTPFQSPDRAATPAVASPIPASSPITSERPLPAASGGGGAATGDASSSAAAASESVGVSQLRRPLSFTSLGGLMGWAAATERSAHPAGAGVAPAAASPSPDASPSPSPAKAAAGQAQGAPSSAAAGAGPSAAIQRLLGSHLDLVCGAAGAADAPESSILPAAVSPAPAAAAKPGVRPTPTVPAPTAAAAPAAAVQSARSKAPAVTLAASPAPAPVTAAAPNRRRIAHDDQDSVNLDWSDLESDHEVDDRLLLGSVGSAEIGGGMAASPAAAAAAAAVGGDCQELLLDRLPAVAAAAVVVTPQAQQQGGRLTPEALRGPSPSRVEDLIGRINAGEL